jgi:hypothetical protein
VILTMAGPPPRQRSSGEPARHFKEQFIRYSTHPHDKPQGMEALLARLRSDGGSNPFR